MAIFYYVVVGIIGLIVGSFLNVVIVRLPQMLIRAWRRDAELYLGIDAQVESQEASPLNLCFPRSFCPHCQHPIAAYDNIPLLSFLWLLGRCRFCQHPISWQYPLVEALSALCALLSFACLGWSIGALWLTLFAWFLICGACIDWHTQLLPDELTWPLLALGLLGSVFHVFITPASSVLGMLVGYYLLWTLYWLFLFLTKKEGLGFGDFKLLAAIGAFFGMYSVFLTLFMSAALGILWVLCHSLYMRVRHSQSVPMIGQKLPFGPFLAIGGWASFWLIHYCPYCREGLYALLF